MPPRNIDDPPSVICYWGSTGSGKTSTIWQNATSTTDVFVYPGKGWFDGFYGQSIALFDDLRDDEIGIGMLLKLLDRYPMLVPYKGGFVNWCPKEIYITSNRNPNTWFINAIQESKDALLRRFTNIVHFEN